MFSIKFHGKNIRPLGVPVADKGETDRSLEPLLTHIHYMGYNLYPRNILFPFSFETASL